MKQPFPLVFACSILLAGVPALAQEGLPGGPVLSGQEPVSALVERARVEDLARVVAERNGLREVPLAGAELTQGVRDAAPVAERRGLKLRERGPEEAALSPEERARLEALLKVDVRRRFDAVYEGLWRGYDERGGSLEDMRGLDEHIRRVAFLGVVHEVWQRLDTVRREQRALQLERLRMMSLRLLGYQPLERGVEAGRPVSEGEPVKGFTDLMHKMKVRTKASRGRR